MKKDFDKWNSLKKIINDTSDYKFYKPREIWWCSFGINIGYEQDGNNSDYERPALIIRAFSKEVCLVIPLTRSNKKNKYHFDLGNISVKKSFAIISQLRLIDTKRLHDLVQVLDNQKFDDIRKAIRDLI
jgi:mRNA-degrading endonuclease toxin of MazEF toxin-antitoxin module